MSIDESFAKESTELIIKPKKKDKKKSLEDDVYEKRFSKIVIRYLKSYFIFDFLACVPILIFEAYHGFSTDFFTVFAMIQSGWYLLFSFLKIFKLLQYLRILEVLTRLG